MSNMMYERRYFPLLTQAAISSSIFSDVAFLGIRASIGIIFLLHGLSKLGNEMYIGWMSSLGISPEFATIIAIGEIVPGILLFVGVLSRLSAGVLAAIMVSAIFIIKDPAIITGDKGIELDLILLAGALVLVVAGPGRLSIAHIAKKIPRPIH